MDDLVKDPIKILTGIHGEGKAGKYIGRPECFSGSKRDLLGFIQEKLKNRLSSVSS